MAKSSADDLELKRACEAAVEGSKHKVVLSIRVAKSRGIFGKSAKLVRQMAKARVLAITTKSKGPKTKAFLRVLKHSNGGILEPAKVYKLKHLSKVEVIQNDPSGCTFMLGFDNLRSQSVAPPQWTMRNTDDRNRLLLCILNMSREILDRLPKVVGMDIVEMALWAKENSPFSTNQTSSEYGIATSVILQDDKQVIVEKDLSFEVEEKDMEALLSSYVLGVSAAEEFSQRMKRELQALEAANVYSILENETLTEEVLQGLEEAAICVEDMHEWLGIFNAKLKHMREDIESIEARNNKLELHYANSKALVEELDKLLELLHIPIKIEASLKGGSFDESCVVTNIEACEWLIGAICRLQVPNLDPSYANMQAVKEKQLEFEMLKSTFVRRATEFLRNYFSSLVDFLINDQNYFSRRGSLKKPDHSELRFKCGAFARLIQILKSLDRSCLGPLREAYCHSLNLLLCQEAREFANELHSSTKAVKSSTPWFEFSTGSVQAANGAETAVFSEAYSKMLTVFIPLLVDESSFFAHFMCFDIPTLANVSINGSNDSENVNHDQEGSNGMMLTSLNESLHGLFNGFQKEFYSFLDWGFECDPLSCITMHGITERCHSGQKVVETGFIRLLLDDLETRISNNFIKFVDDCIYEIEKTERNNAHQVLPYIPRFALLATRMEQYIQGQSRDLVDQAYTKIISIMFVCLERAAQFDPKYSDIVLLENYAAFQNSIYDLANVVPTLAKFYRQASESYDQACTHHINMVIFITFERLFLFARRIEDLMFTITPEEIQFHVGMSKSDFRKMLKASLSGFEKSTVVMHKKLQKNLTSEWLLPSLWDKCKKGFLDKYGSFVNLVSKIYPGESIPSVSEMRELLAQYK